MADSRSFGALCLLSIICITYIYPNNHTDTDIIWMGWKKKESCLGIMYMWSETEMSFEVILTPRLINYFLVLCVKFSSYLLITFYAYLITSATPLALNKKCMKHVGCMDQSLIFSSMMMYRSCKKWYNFVFRL